MKEKNNNNKHKLRRRDVILLVFCLLLSIGIAGAVYARYVYSDYDKTTRITSDEFYFATNVKGDAYTKYLNPDPVLKNDDETSALGSYSYIDRLESVEYEIYGGVEHTETFEISNYLDSLRVTAYDIGYKVLLSAKTPVYDTSGELTGYEETDVSKIATIAPTEEKDEYVLKANNGTPVYDTWQLNIKSVSDGKYADGTIITIYIISTYPYYSILEINFTLHESTAPVTYTITNEEGYYEMTLMATVDVGDIYLCWPKDIAIDNTNTLTYIDFDNQMEIKETETGYIMAISRPLRAGESVTILFFKTIEKSEIEDLTINTKITVTEESNEPICAIQKINASN